MATFSFVNIENIFGLSVSPKYYFSLGLIFLLIVVAYVVVKKKKITKGNARILFIDDKEFPVVAQLREARWSVEKIDDLQNLDDDYVKRSHIIFVDYKDVGKKIAGQDEGIGLCKILKEKYGDSKRIILYSGYGRYKGDFINRVREYTHNHLPKDSTVAVFTTMIEGELGNIKRSWKDYIL